MVDVWVHGRVDRISPEAPVPVFVEERREDKWGGAANVVANLRALGCQASGSFKEYRLWPIKTRFVVNNQQMGLRHDLENFVAGDFEDKVFIDATSRECDALIISDYAKGVCTPSLCQRLIKWAKEHGGKVVVDPKQDWAKYAGCDVVTPNMKELLLVPESFTLDCKAMLVTKGAEGMTLYANGDMEGINIPATNTGPVDVTGAGDTVVAVLSAAIAVGFDLESAARLANAAAGVVVGKFGTATCTIEELEEAWSRVSRTDASTSCMQGTDIS
jgi:D-beta-D-heptose 7-phosphate kinase/D-beta-D-heptose 1-phosphate adenosyltransferase